MVIALDYYFDIVTGIFCDSLALLLQNENESLTKQLEASVDQAAGLCEKAIKLEMKCDRLKSRLHDFETGVGWVKQTSLS